MAFLGVAWRRWLYRCVAPICVQTQRRRQKSHLIPMLDDIKKTLWATADKLRANMDAAEYKHLVLGLIFLKYISDTFAARRAEVAVRLSDPGDEYYYGDASPEDLAAELDDRDYYISVNLFWVPENARWETLRAQAKQPEIGKHIDDALSTIEARRQAGRAGRLGIHHRLWRHARRGPRHPGPGV